ncbi:GGDEF domain-containing phosphodiesterase [Proteiniborus sp. MB09-C3]|uniref:putative bifunctional diguanylate cyclase/phosphodiesterase n=1 Tax=Proteiniborus sp. MB09-C3 TaxID=3050072 RepID=UPI0025547614|nr:GGDEF domain-containing phosphodiesterase [Proteiniborus sp. MB09-C3]WIV13008.1 GGDEF domain-containing phosphodiesterase [Proteiniborus sp. MB09-C3]
MLEVLLVLIIIVALLIVIIARQRKRNGEKYIEDQLTKQDKYDALTGLPNEKHLNEFLAKKIESKMAGDKKQFLISIRVTNYNEIVAGYGYRLMDEVIISMVRRIELIFNGIGKLFRSGKEEFIVLVNMDEDIHNLDSIIESLNETISIGFNTEAGIIFINMAMGILSITNKYNNVNKMINDLILSTDWAEKSDNANYVYYSESIREKLRKDVKLETLLRAAIDNMELSLLYQPQIDPKTNKMVGVEALLRWDNDELGQIPPFVFIPIAEKIGVINDISNWVIKEACKQNKKWQEKGLPKIPVSVNLSPVQFKDNKISDEIREILEECELEGKYLGIEITEGTLVENRQDINEKLCSLKAMGISISIDDFGTGYSSLGYLRELAFDNIKIDREFIKDYPDNDDGVIAKIILSLSRELKINSVAEGVETKEQLDFIMNNGGDFIQGYYYSPPVSAGKIEELLTKKNESA